MPTVTIGDNSTDTYSGTADVFISEASPTTNQNFNNYFEVTKYDAGNWNIGLLKFSGLSNIPSNATITAASIFIYQYLADLANNTFKVGAKRLLRDWVEGQANWDIYSTGNNWGMGGAFNNTSDRVDTIAFETAGLPSTGTAYREIVGNSTGIAQVQAIVSGSAANYGWQLERTDGTVNDLAYRIFRSREASDGLRPYLSVTYSLPTAPLFGAAIY